MIFLQRLLWEQATAMAYLWPSPQRATGRAVVTYGNHFSLSPRKSPASPIRGLWQLWDFFLFFFFRFVVILFLAGGISEFAKQHRKQPVNDMGVHGSLTRVLADGAGRLELSWDRRGPLAHSAFWDVSGWSSRMGQCALSTSSESALPQTFIIREGRRQTQSQGHASTQ